MDKRYEHVRTYLLEHSEPFNSLHAKHRRLDQQIEKLEQKKALTTQERMDIKALKRKKLYLKDQLEDMILAHMQKQTP